MRSRDAHRLTDANVPPTSPSPPATDASSLAGADASPIVDAVAGAVGALLALLSTYPLMTLNTRQHTEPGARRDGGDDGDGERKRDAGSHGRSIVDELRAVANENGGFAGLYRGIEPAVIGTVSSQAVYNYVYAALRGAAARLGTENGGGARKSLSALESLAIASVAGSINVALTIPIWTVCVRMQAERADEGAGKREEGAVATRPDAGADEKGDDEAERQRVASRAALGRARGSPDRSDRSDATAVPSFSRARDGTRKKTFLETTAEVWDESGPAGFWRGVVPSLIMVSNPALQYAFYESASDAFRRRRRVRTVAGSDPTRLAAGPRALTALEVFVAASLAKMGATVLTYPVLLVKTRLQASKGKRSKPADDKEDDPATLEREGSSAPYDGAFDALRRIAREEGVAAFYRGMGTKMTQTVFAAALMFVTKEEIAKAVRAAFARKKVAAQSVRT